MTSRHPEGEGPAGARGTCRSSPSGGTAGSSSPGETEAPRNDGRRLLIGVGNPFRGDDGAGRAVARRIAARNDCVFEVRECTGDATALMSSWTGFDDVVLVDACRGAGPPGSVHRIGPDEVERVARLQHASTHSLGVAAAIGLARALGSLPSRLVIYAIEARHSLEGERLSPEVDRAVHQVVALVMQEAHV